MLPISAKLNNALLDTLKSFLTLAKYGASCKGLAKCRDADDVCENEHYCSDLNSEWFEPLTLPPLTGIHCNLLFEDPLGQKKPTWRTVAQDLAHDLVQYANRAFAPDGMSGVVEVAGKVVVERVVVNCVYAVNHPFGNIRLYVQV